MGLLVAAESGEARERLAEASRACQERLVESVQSEHDRRLKDNEVKIAKAAVAGLQASLKAT